MSPQTRTVVFVSELDLEAARSPEAARLRDDADVYMRQAFMMEVRLAKGRPWWPSVVMSAPRLLETMRERTMLTAQVEVSA